MMKDRKNKVKAKKGKTEERTMKKEREKRLKDR